MHHVLLPKSYTPLKTVESKGKKIETKQYIREISSYIFLIVLPHKDK